MYREHYAEKEAALPARKWAEMYLPTHHPVLVVMSNGALAKLSGAGVPDNCADVDAWIAEAPPLTAWAVLKDGVWSEKGRAGWFGMSSDNRDALAWEDEVDNLVKGLPGTAWIAMVDCHI